MQKVREDGRAVRAKVIKKPKGKEQYYGRVGSVDKSGVMGGVRKIAIKFDTGEMETFWLDELRMGVKASG